MKSALLVTLGLGLCACMPPFTFDNQSAYPDALFFGVHDGIEQVVGEIDLLQFRIYVAGVPEVFAAHCPDITRLGCSDFEERVALNGSVGTSAADVGAEEAHILGHIFYLQHEDDSDPNHYHAEWFGPGGIEEQVRYKILMDPGLSP